MLRRACWQAAAALGTLAAGHASAQPQPQPQPQPQQPPLGAPPTHLTERMTGRALPHARDDASALLALDARCMLLWCSLPLARVYAFAVYLDPLLLAFARALHAAAPLPPHELVPALLDQLERYHALGTGRASGQPGAITIALTLDRAIDGPHLGRGFEKSIEARLRDVHRERVGGVEDLDGALVQLRALGAAFQGQEFAAGEELAFAWRAAQGYTELAVAAPGGGARRQRSDGAAWPRLTHPTLCRAVCEVYVGRKAVAVGARASFAANLHAHASGSASGGSLAEHVAREYLAGSA
jgi:hypothetical protein